MLLMVIEHFKDVAAIGDRFRAKGRMLPDGVSYCSSWIDAAGHRCFQIMEAPDEESLRPWLAAWTDLVEFEIVPVITSSEFWSPITVPEDIDRMSTSVINFKDKLAKFSDHWAPKVIAEMNDYQFKLVKIQGEFVWHSHADTDEVFIMLEGEMTIELRDGPVHLKEGEMFVVPKGVEHKPVAQAECKIMLVEPRGVVNTGDAGGAYTAPNDVWI